MVMCDQLLVPPKITTVIGLYFDNQQRKSYNLQTLSTAVVQVFGTEGPHHNTWRKRYCGVVTFTKDNVRRSYYIQVSSTLSEDIFIFQLLCGLRMFGSLSMFPLRYIFIS